jgi:hypothetical protein
MERSLENQTKLTRCNKKAQQHLEASFQHDGVFVKIDILAKAKGGGRSTRVKKLNLAEGFIHPRRRSPVLMWPKAQGSTSSASSNPHKQPVCPQRRIRG